MRNCEYTVAIWFKVSLNRYDDWLLSLKTVSGWSHQRVTFKCQSFQGRTKLNGFFHTENYNQKK